MRTERSLVLFAFLAVPFATGCGSLEPPVDAWKEQNYTVTAFRLQNYEPPQTTTAATTPQVAIPPQFQQLLTMLPPNLIPPGLLPNAPAPDPNANANVARFHNFRILSYQTVPADTREDIFALLGKKSNWEAPKGGCGNNFYAEFGLAFQPANSPPSTPSNDVLISLSCGQVQAFGFAWPHGANVGITDAANKQIVDIVRRTFGN